MLISSVEITVTEHFKENYAKIWSNSENTQKGETEMNEIDEVTSARWEIWGISGVRRCGEPRLF